jgi:hypothetical protein
MPNVIDKLNNAEERLQYLEEKLRISKDKKLKKSILPAKIRSFFRKKPEKLICLFLGSDGRASFKEARVDGGLLLVGNEQFSYEPGSIYTLDKKNNLVVVFEWRLLPVGGKAEEFKTRLLGGESDAKLAQDLNITTYAQRTIIRGIEQAEAVGAQKSKLGWNPVWWVLVAGLVIYVISRMFT